MGSYASHSDTIHPTQAFELAEYCTACGNTGWVDYPVTVHVSEQDECPHGCMDAEDLMDMDVDDIDSAHVDQYEALLPNEHQALPEELEEAYRLVLHEYRIQEKDPFLSLSHQFRLRGYKRFLSVAAQHQGMVTTDDYVQGFMRDGRHVYHISIPPYLVGNVIEYDEDYAHIRYEYMGSFLDTWVTARDLRSHFRFAYSWDRSYTTREVMSSF